MNLQSRLKVCGLTMLDQVHELISMNTDFLGFIFYEKSPRYVLNHLSLEDISDITHQGKVGVFVNESINKIIETAERADLNFIQLHGDENEGFISELRRKLKPTVGIIKVIRVGNRDPEVMNTIEKAIHNQLSSISYFLFDTDSQSFGGTGKQFDWDILNEFELPIPYFLSGGISEENIKDIKKLKQKPFAIDINSKFEIKAGIKDLEKIKRLHERL